MELVTHFLRLDFPKTLVSQPLISDLVKRFDLTVNIRHADCGAFGGYLVLAISGTPATLEAAQRYIHDIGVSVTPVEAELN